MSEHERAMDELLGAYALDAVSDDERRDVEEYLRVSPRARAEVQDHREVATMLAWTGTSAPEGLWERISGQLDDHAPAPTGELAAVLAFEAPRVGETGNDRSTTGVGEVGSSAGQRRAQARRRRSWAQSAGAWVAASAAAAVVAVVVVEAIQSRGDNESPIDAAAAQARNDRDSTVATLVSADGTVGAEAIVDQDGHGFLIARALPALPDDRTYQLWGVIDGKAISLGVLGRRPEVEIFTADGAITQIVVTNEAAGGVISNGSSIGAFAGMLT